MAGTKAKEVEAEIVFQCSTSNAPPSDIDSILNAPPNMGTADADLFPAGLEVIGIGLSASVAIDIDHLASQTSG